MTWQSNAIVFPLTEKPQDNTADKVETLKDQMALEYKAIQDNAPNNPSKPTNSQSSLLRKKSSNKGFRRLFGK